MWIATTIQPSRKVVNCFQSCGQCYVHISYTFDVYICIIFIIKTTTPHPGGVRSHDPMLQSPLWLAETLTLDQAVRAYIHTYNIICIHLKNMYWQFEIYKNSILKNIGPWKPSDDLNSSNHDVFKLGVIVHICETILITMHCFKMPTVNKIWVNEETVKMVLCRPWGFWDVKPALSLVVHMYPFFNKRFVKRWRALAQSGVPNRLWWAERVENILDNILSLFSDFVLNV
jgi:hypothetical protein